MKIMQFCYITTDCLVIVKSFIVYQKNWEGYNKIIGKKKLSK